MTTTLSQVLWIALLLKEPYWKHFLYLHVMAQLCPVFNESEMPAHPQAEFHLLVFQSILLWDNHFLNVRPWELYTGTSSERIRHTRDSLYANFPQVFSICSPMLLMGTPICITVLDGNRWILRQLRRFALQKLQAGTKLLHVSSPWWISFVVVSSSPFLLKFNFIYIHCGEQNNSISWISEEPNC